MFKSELIILKQMSLTKKSKIKPNYLLIVLVVWFAVSALYIVQDLWRNGLSMTYQAGYEKAVSEILVRSQSCQPLEIFVGEARAELVSLECLQAAQQQAQSQSGQTSLEQDES
jgi:hypothetical protein